MVTAVVAGAIANTAHRGGDTWHRLHWVQGLRRLGVRVHLVEQIAEPACVGVGGAPARVEESENVAYFADVRRMFGLAATLVTEGGPVAGLGRAELKDLVAAADLFINISGHLDWQALELTPRRAVFVDEDPGFTQMWHAMGVGPRLDGYHRYYTVGANIGTPKAPAVPTGGIEWRPLRPFVVLREWPFSRPVSFQGFTTVAGWRGPFDALEFRGTRYGVKAHEFRKFADVPRATGERFELALDIHPSDARDQELLERSGWRLVDPRTVAGDPLAFRRYVQQSGAEFSVAKGMYVQTNSGWFSDRTLR